MTSTDPKQTKPSKEAAVGSDDSGDQESHRDDMWVVVSQFEESNAENGDKTDETSCCHDNNSHYEAECADNSVKHAAIKNTGEDAMSKYGHALEAVEEDHDGIDPDNLGHVVESAVQPSAKDQAVAPHIAAAEREIEEAKTGSIDIFDRIAQAAESQFDESRGSTAKRVSELVDDRRVGTKRWTPSKTMKERMAKLEAARAAASGETPQNMADTQPETFAEPEPVKASAPASSKAETVKPESATASEPAYAREDAPEQEISRKRERPEAEETLESESIEAFDTPSDDEDHDTEGLRVVPGARGRRRDRARKSRLDEDFEKIFDDEGKPTINSLRRKLRSSAAEDALAEEEVKPAANKMRSLANVMKPEVSEGEEGEKTGLFSRFLKAKSKKDAEKNAAGIDGEDDMIAAFDADNDDENMLLDDEDTWQDAVDEQKMKKRIPKPVIGVGITGLFGGLGWVLYKFIIGA